MITSTGYNDTAAIFLIEDNATDVMMIKEAFKQHKVTNPVNTARDGAIAIKLLKQCCPLPGLIILDLNLPKVGGHDVLAEIKEDSTLGNIPVIIFTSSKSEKDISLAYKLRANCYITKPMDFGKFSNAIKLIRDFWLGTVSLPKETT